MEKQEERTDRLQEFSCGINSQFGEEILASPDGHLPSGRHIVDYRIENDSIVYTEEVK